MKWKNRKKSSNVDDRRTSSGRSSGKGFKMPSLQTLMFIYPFVKPLLRSKFGLFVVGAGALAYMSGFNPLSMVGMGGSSSLVPTSKASKAADEEKANLVKTILADTESVWGDLFSKARLRYKEPKMVIYRGSTRSGCGVAQAQVGPFYCPNDQTVYIDLGFFDELEHKFGAKGDFAQAYILAHEIGHHIQNLEGTLQKVQEKKQGSFFGNKANENALQVKVELQADCYAGIWAHYQHKKTHFLEEGDIDEALGAANSIGDDRLQKQSRGYVTPDSFTHGTSKQRMSWFYKGLESGDVSACNTFK